MASDYLKLDGKLKEDLQNMFFFGQYILLGMGIITFYWEWKENVNNRGLLDVFI